MILVFGGTTEGRICVKTLDEAGSSFFYSTRGTEQKVESRHGIRISGMLDEKAMAVFCRQNDIKLIVDAAHPFAVTLHGTIADVAAELRIPVLRYERVFPTPDSADILCDSYEDAVNKLKQSEVHCLLALTGVQTIGKLKGYWRNHRCVFRVLNRDTSFDLAEKEGFRKEQLVVYDTTIPDEDLIKSVGADAVITKESGISGGFEEKERACLKLGIPLYVVRRPAMPECFKTVTGKYGLRRAVEELLPEFYPLHSGFTTGSCAVVAAKAALFALLGRSVPMNMPFFLPDGEELYMKIDRAFAEDGIGKAEVTKVAGDDPDITDGHIIAAEVAFSSEPGIRFVRGIGVGVVTLPGLGIAVGDVAINMTPRKMIRQELESIYTGGLTVRISVPDGGQLSKNTFNPRIGIVGGISIIGTSGIVIPFSAEAFVDAIKREIDVAVAMNVPRVVFNSGAKSEKYVKQYYPDLPQQAFIHFGNFIGDSLRVADEMGVKTVTLGVMLGKAVKLSAGNLDTHSKKVTLDKNFLISVAKESGCSEKSENIIRELVLARSLWEKLSESDSNKFFPLLLKKAYMTCRNVYPRYSLTLLLIMEDGSIPYVIGN